MPNLNPNNEASGLAFPFKVSRSGGIETMTSDELITAYVRIYCSDCESDNPYQDLGIGSDAIFQVSSDASWKAQVRRKVKQAFSLYLEPSNLAKLKSISFSKDTEGEDNVDIIFFSIETNEELAINIPVSEVT